MKFFKGCLIILLVFVGISVTLYYVFKNNVASNLEVLDTDEKKRWSLYLDALTERNKIVLQHQFKNDSLAFYIKRHWEYRQHSILAVSFNEYKINQLVMADTLFGGINAKLNLILDHYNQSVQSYNSYRFRLPNSLFARKTNYPKFHTYFDIRYGIENKNPIIKEEKKQHWIRTGDALK